jgi:arylsulfatase A-like enzyme
MMTGRYPDEMPADWKTALDGRASTLAEILRGRGYATGGFVANVRYTSRETGLGRGFARFEDYPVTMRETLWSSSYTQTRLFDQLSEAKTFRQVFSALRSPNLWIRMVHEHDSRHGENVTREFLDWSAAQQGRPFFAFLNYFDAHAPYYAPAPFDRFEGERGYGTYLGAISFLDAQIDTILTTLRERGALDNTIVVVAADHGELFGEHDFYGHAHNMYLNTLHVPLVLRFPRAVPRGVRVTQPVSLRDLPATILRLAGAPQSTVPGHSLTPLIAGDSTATSAILAEVTKAQNIEPVYPTARGDMTAALDARWHYIRNHGDGREELYDYRADPLQRANAGGGADSSNVLAPWRAYVAREKATHRKYEGVRR